MQVETGDDSVRLVLRTPNPRQFLRFCEPVVSQSVRFGKNGMDCARTHTHASCISDACGGMPPSLAMANVVAAAASGTTPPKAEGRKGWKN